MKENPDGSRTYTADDLAPTGRVDSGPRPRDRAMSEWRSDMENAPRDGTPILGWNAEGHEILTWTDKEEDGPDQPGNDAGWVGVYAFPGRTREAGFGGADHWISQPQGQPTHWQPLPTPPDAGTPT